MNDSSCPERDEEQEEWAARINWPLVWAATGLLALALVAYGVSVVTSFKLGMAAGHLQVCDQ